MNKIIQTFVYLMVSVGCTMHGAFVPVVGKITNLYPFMQDNLQLLYKGHALQLSLQTRHTESTQNQAVSFALLEERSLQSLHILISDSIVPEVRDNTVHNLLVQEDAEYKFYTLHAKRQYSEYGDLEAYTWDITEDVLQGNKTIPENTLIVWSDPLLFDTIMPCSWSPEKTTRLIPELVCNSDLSREQVQDLLTKSLFKFLDIKAFHQNQKSHICRKPTPETVALLLQM